MNIRLMCSVYFSHFVQHFKIAVHSLIIRHVHNAVRSRLVFSVAPAATATFLECAFTSHTLVDQHHGFPNRSSR